MNKIYKEPNRLEIETTINVLYSENILSIYTNKVDLQKKQKIYYYKLYEMWIYRNL